LQRVEGLIFGHSEGLEGQEGFLLHLMIETSLVVKKYLIE
jgi:hypothetical protein